MKKSIARKWVAALRSGEYKQGRNYLRSGVNEFCCLGVLCDLFEQSHPITAKWQFDPNMDAYRFKESNSHVCGDAIATLPRDVRDWSGVKNDVCRINARESLVTENDSNGESFATIADLIEDHWRDL